MANGEGVAGIRKGSSRLTVLCLTIKKLFSNIRRCVVQAVAGGGCCFLLHVNMYFKCVEVYVQGIHIDDKMKKEGV